MQYGDPVKGWASDHLMSSLHGTLITPYPKQILCRIARFGRSKMLKASGHVTLIDVDLPLFKKHFKEDMSANIQNALKVWLLAASDRVPVLTGMAKGSLLEAAEVAGSYLFISPRGQRNRISKGRALGTIKPKYGPRIYSMIITSKVEHYVLQEERNVGVSPSAPWKSFDAGIAAVEEFVPKLRDIPVRITKRTF